MRQEQSLAAVYLAKAGLRARTTACAPERDDLRWIADQARMNAARDGGLVAAALDLASLLYDINALATASGIDLEPFIDHIHARRMGERADTGQLDSDAALMATISEKDQIQRLLDREDLDLAERGQVETCAHLHRVGIPLRWPQRVALARIDARARRPVSVAA